MRFSRELLEPDSGTEDIPVRVGLEEQIVLGKFPGRPQTHTQVNECPLVVLLKQVIDRRMILWPRPTRHVFGVDAA